MHYKIGSGKAKSMFKSVARCLPFCKDTRGSSAVEFALVAPILFGLMLGIVDFGRLLWLSSSVEHAATAGARYAGVRGSGNYGALTPTQLQAEIESAVQARAAGIAASDLPVLIAWRDAAGLDSPPPNNNSGGTVRVTVTYEFQFFLIGFLPLNPITLTGISTVIIA